MSRPLSLAGGLCLTKLSSPSDRRRCWLEKSSIFTFPKPRFRSRVSSSLSRFTTIFLTCCFSYEKKKNKKLIRCRPTVSCFAVFFSPNIEAYGICIKIIHSYLFLNGRKFLDVFIILTCHYSISTFFLNLFAYFIQFNCWFSRYYC